MNRDEIIRMAREAGFGLSHDGTWLCAINHIERFANLVAAAEREACAKRLDAVGCDHCAKNIRLRGRE